LENWPEKSSNDWKYLDTGMTTTPQQIDQLLAIRSEHERLEFKAAENHYEFENLVEYCVALGGEDVSGNRHPRIGGECADSSRFY
jgi:hypothetical protein